MAVVTVQDESAILMGFGQIGFTHLSPKGLVVHRHMAMVLAGLMETSMMDSQGCFFPCLFPVSFWMFTGA